MEIEWILIWTYNLGWIFKEKGGSSWILGRRKEIALQNIC